MKSLVHDMPTWLVGLQIAMEDCLLPERPLYMKCPISWWNAGTSGSMALLLLHQSSSGACTFTEAGARPSPFESWCLRGKESAF